MSIQDGATINVGECFAEPPIIAAFDGWFVVFGNWDS
jgi:hypothetical protein